ncbi:MAG: transposase [Janthinobacterium lividum]
MTPKVHALVDALGNGLRLALPPGAVVADRADDTNAVLAAVARADAELVIPPRISRKQQRAYDTNLYADRNKVERFFGRLKEARGFATRYEKTATSFLAVAHLLAALDWIR